jgi:hypothetical protein
MSTEHSGVIACRSISTTRPEVAPQKSSPFKAWPGIQERDRYYLLPTIGAIYRLEWTSTTKIPEEEIIRAFPQLEPYRSHLMPMVVEYYLSNFDKVFNTHNFQVAVGKVVFDLLIGDVPASDVWLSLDNSWLTEAVKASSIEDMFSMSHESAHKNSFEIIRPATTQFKATWSGIEDLLQQAASGSSNDFWDKFTDLNNKLGACLTNSLVLEELRANIFAIQTFIGTPNVQEEFIKKIYGEGRENARNNEGKIFHSLRSVTGGDIDFAWALTLLAECLNPDNPLSALAELQQVLEAESADSWSGERWRSWFNSWRWLDTWDNVAKMLVTVDLSRIIPNATLTDTPKGIIEISCPETMRLALFYESMRQQLFYRERVRPLICPFKERRRSCCGFGHKLRNIWAAIPKEKRHRLKPPSRVCLQYAPICPS